MADAALGRGHGAQEGRVVVVVHPQAQPRAQVADLGAVEEALAARHLVGDLRLAQRLLEDARLVVGTVQDGEFLPLLAEPRARIDWMRATVRSASCSSLSQSTMRTGSPSPSSENSVLGNSFGFGWITLLAARRMALVER